MKMRRDLLVSASARAPNPSRSGTVQLQRGGFGSTSESASRPLPKAPVLGWGDFWPPRRSHLANIADLPHVMTTSGRAALLAALRQAQLPPGSGVLVPSYHCPTMVAPVVRAGLEPIFFALDQHGLPVLDSIPNEKATSARVMFAAQYFGLPRSLHAVSDWCQARGIILVEDCAHSFFGRAGDRPVGHWGDFAIASLSKFFPVPEAGLLASAHRALRPTVLQPSSARWQLKSAFDVLHHAHTHRHLIGPSWLAAPLNWRRSTEPRALDNGPVGVLAASEQATMKGADMERTEQVPTLAARLVFGLLPEAPIVQRRRRNYLLWQAALKNASGGRALVDEMPSDCAPYVFPFWVDGPERADRVYAASRSAGLPVFRWDRIWPGTPLDSSDSGAQWSRQVLQLLCHQSLRPMDIQRSAEALRHSLHAF